MKKIFIILVMSISLMLMSNQAQAQAFPPPTHGQTVDQTGSTTGAPIGTGVVILLGLGAAYSGKKYYEMNKTSLDE